MKYRKKLNILLTIIGILSAAYICGLIFSPERMLSRVSLFSWLDPKLADSAEKISISSFSEDTINLIRKNNSWFVLNDEKEYPARQLRVDDFIGILTRRASYPLRSSSASNHERLGLDNSNASRIIVSGPYGQVLLDLLIGYGDMTGQNVYLRKQGNNEVRSGEDKITVYLSGGLESWYNLRLIPETEDNILDIDKVQRLSAYLPSDASDNFADPLIFTRKSRQWTFNRIEDTELDMDKVDVYVRGILYAEGDGFSSEIDPGDSIFNNSRFILELGNGVVKTIYLSAADEENRRYAVVSGTDSVYTMAGWMADRFFNTADYFRKE